MLVLQLRNNEVKAFDKLFYKYNNKLFRFSLSMLKNEEDSKEIVQETFLRIWNRRHEVESTKSFNSFLFTISYNLIIDQLRLRLKDQKYRKYLENKLNVNTISMHNAGDYNIISNQIKFVIEELPKKRKHIFLLSREKGLSHKEIANELGIKVKTVENQISLSLKHIKLRMGKESFSTMLNL